ncbi:GNAT superfamily N-acetyltransferase [Aquamicrobium terrae]|uniref:GNAT superfamily N-acetyltransferase n=1 Tax=Aquamicrobium terrae TaxID=1324945 RepID=A0ABV2MY78_9HYPH
MRRRAHANQISGASRCYVLCRGDRVVGYYALAAGSIAHAMPSRRHRQNMPDPVPVIVLGRLAVARSEQGNGLGRALLRDALLRISAAADAVGIAAVLVHALDERAKAFYLNCGFAISPIDPLTLIARIHDIRAAMGER